MELEKLREKVLRGRSFDQEEVGKASVVNNDGLKPIPKSILLGTLQPFDRIRLQTVNSEYDIYLLSPGMGMAFVQGGKHLPNPVEAEIRGTHLGGLIVIDGLIETGFGVEFRVRQKRIITSIVEDFEVERAADRLN